MKSMFGAIALILSSVPTAWAADAVKPVKEFRGSVEDEKLAGAAPADHVVASKAALEKLWKAWGIKDDMPALDFSKEIVLTATSRGSRLNVNAVLNDGDLKVSAFGTKDLRPGFRYHLIVIKREGIKTIGGKEPPKE